MNKEYTLPLLQDKYQIVKKIGEGAYSNVYLAEHIDKKTKVAIKMDKNENEISTKLMKHEIRVYLQLRKRKIEKLLGIKSFGIYNKNYYLIMNYLPYSLEHIVKQRKDLLYTMFQEVMRILQQLHDNDFVHRDIKPDNFLVSTRGKVYLIDLGLMCAIDRKTSLKHLIGSPLYCSYMVHERGPYLPRDDIISAYYMFFYLFANGVLPWSHICIENKLEKEKVICLLKKHTDYDAFYLNVPELNYHDIRGCIRKYKEYVGNQEV